MIKTVLFLASLPVLALAGCVPSANHDVPMNNLPASGSAGMANNTDAYYTRQLPVLQAKDPEADATAAIKRGERYFLCNAGRSATVPGIDPEVFALVRNNCPTQCLDGVTDALLGPNHHRYLEVALEYSARWNKVMLSACRQ